MSKIITVILFIYYSDIKLHKTSTYRGSTQKNACVSARSAMKKMVILHRSFLRRRKPALRRAWVPGSRVHRLRKGQLHLRCPCGRHLFCAAISILRSHGSTLYKEVVLAQPKEAGRVEFVVNGSSHLWMVLVFCLCKNRYILIRKIV